MTLNSDTKTGLEDESFHIITSLRWIRFNIEDDRNEFTDIVKSDQLLLPLHHDRLTNSALAFNWHKCIEFLQANGGTSYIEAKIEEYLLSLPSPSRGWFLLYKLRISISKDAEIAFDATVIGEKELNAIPRQALVPNVLSKPDLNLIPICKVYLDKQPTPSSLFTTHKTTYRPMYSSARERVGISKCGPMEAEVLIRNVHYEIMECSSSTPYFFRDEKWITPPLSCGGNAGVTRRKALEQNLCQEAVVELSSITNEEIIWLSNGVRGFFLGRIWLSEE